MQITEIKLEDIKINPYQARKFFPKSSLASLADSIKRYGVLQPVIVNQYNELISGERRFRACKLLNMQTIPAITITASEKQTLFIPLIDNLQCNNLNYIEQAQGLFNIMNDCQLSIEQLANEINQSEDFVMRKLYLLNLSKTIQNILLENNLSEDYAFALLKLNDEQLQHEILDKVIYYGLSVKTTKNLIDKTLRQSDDNHKIKSVIKDLRVFFNTIRQAVDITKESGFNTEYLINEQSGNIEINIKIASTQRNPYTAS